MWRLKTPIEPWSRVSRENTIILLCITRRRSGQNEAGNPEDDTSGEAQQSNSDCEGERVADEEN